MELKEILFASHNQGKIDEITKILEPFKIKVISAKDIKMPDVEETGTTFEENAVIKAGSIAKIMKKPALADDSGLCVTALDGRPGVYSARYAPDRDFDKGMDKLLAEIKASGRDDRSAYFTCFLALVYPDGTYDGFEGRVEGIIAEQKRGTGGFGFDPVFIPNGYDKTFAELSSEIKNKISHRGRALEKFVKFLKTKK